MRRFAVTLGGLGYGLGITWVCLLVLSHGQWLRTPNKVAHGCHELGKCALPWWEGGVLLAYIFGPAVLMAGINAYAWRRWSVKRWTCSMVGATLAATVLYFVGAIW